MKEEESHSPHHSMEEEQEEDQIQTQTQTQPDQINHRPHHQIQPYNGGGGGREDCWSEGATATLIEAWGNRYLQLSRGNLRQKDWKEVADAVNDRRDSVNKPRRTDIQCKNRIDTVKKKYKIEKAKPAPSKWPFYSRLDHLIGTTTPPASNKRFVQTPSVNKSGVTFTARSIKGKLNPNPSHSHSHSHNPNSVTFITGRSLQGKQNPNPSHSHSPNGVMYARGGVSSKSRLKTEGSYESSDEGDEDDEEEDEDEDDLEFNGGAKRHRVDTESSEGTGFRELAKAIVKFGEIYERIESSKQQQMMELERQRMELTKELEFQRMQMFMDTQIEIEKRKRPKYASGTAGKKL